MNWRKTTELQNPKHATVLFGLSKSPQTKDIFLRESLYYDFKTLLCVLKWPKAS